LLKFKYDKEHLCPSCKQGKSKRASHPPKPVLNSRQRFHLLQIDLCGPMKIANINRKRKKKIMETVNVSFDELSAMAFEQRSSKPGLQSMTSRQISSGLDLTYAPSTTTTQQPTECELDLLFEAMYDDYIGGQPSTTARTDHPLELVIREPSRPVLTRNQLRSDGDMCMYALTVITMAPKNVKEAMTDPASIESMQEELLQFKRLDDLGFKLTGFSDADYARCKDTFKSTFGEAHFLGEKLVSWSSKKQDCTVLSTAEAEYVSLSTCCAQVLWMRTQLTDYGFHFNKIPIYCDSKSAIAISCNPVQHSRTKHSAVRYHFIKEHIENGTIELYFVKMDYQLADLFTKALPADRFNYLVRRLYMRSLSPQELDRLAKS
nr:retrovirus-related Pol polyprotein from transposon TNT 1-94 [Tanacetum cinerariifolium]